jgi:hypothetical protein
MTFLRGPGIQVASCTTFASPRFSGSREVFVGSAERLRAVFARLPSQVPIMSPTTLASPGKLAATASDQAQVKIA